MIIIYITDDTIDKFIKEDIPYIDLTTLILDIGKKKRKDRVHFKRKCNN